LCRRRSRVSLWRIHPITTAAMPRLPLPAAVATLALLVAGAALAQDSEGAYGAATTPPFNVIGRDDAPVSIIEFSDLQCPYCARYAAQTFPRLRAEYVDTGKVRYAVGDLPLPMHPKAMGAAIAVRCAGEQGRYWEYRDALFRSRNTLGAATYDRLAGEFRLDVPRFDACRNDPAQAERVRADMALARSNGIVSTPAFVIGRLVDGEFRGEVVTGAKPYEYFAAKIDALLATPER
jgi:protein-disulfide isomerase